MKHFVASQGSVYEICNRSDTELTAKRFDIDPKSGNVTKTVEISWSCKLKVECLVAADCREKLTGKCSPFLLVYVSSHGSKNVNSDSVFYIVCIDIDGKKFIPLRKFKSTLIQPKTLAKCDGDSIDNRQTLHLLDGPTVLALHESNLHIFWENVPGCHQLKENFTKLVIPEHWEQMCCKQAKRKAVKTGEIIGVKCQAEVCLAFVKLRTREKCPLHSKQKSKELVVAKFYKGQLACIDARELIPSEYRVMVECIFVQHLQIVDSKHMSVIYAGTSDGFVLHLESSVLKRCISLPTTGPIARLISIKSPSRQEGQLLAFQNGSVTVMNSNLKLGTNFPDIQCVFQGDFMRNGTTQALLCKDLFSETTRWCLTDFEDLCIHSNEITEGENSSNTATDGDKQELESNTHSAVIALQARLQREKVTLHDTEQIVEERAAFLHEVCSHHVDMSAGIKSVRGCHKVQLVPLVHGTDIPDHQGGQLSESQPATDVHVGDIWQRTYRDQWCVAVDIVNKSPRNIRAWLQIIPFGDAGLTSVLGSFSKPTVLLSSAKTTCSMLPSQRETTSVSLLSITETTAMDHSASKRAKFMDSASKSFPTHPDVPGLSSKSIQLSPSHGRKIHNKLTVSTVICVPSFGHSNSFNVHVLLKWKHDDESKPSSAVNHPSFDTESGTMGDSRQKHCDVADGGSRLVCEGSNRGHIYTVDCGSLQLTSDEVVQEVYEVRFDRALPTGAGDSDSSGEVTMQDLKDSQRDVEAWQLLQSVVHLSVKSTPGISAQLSHMIEERCGFRYNSAYKCYTTQITPLRCVQMTLGEPTATNTRTLNVYHRHERDVLLLVHHLYSRLPDHVIIVPVQPASFRNLLPSMHREVHFLSHGLRQLLTEHESKKSVEGANDSEDDDDIRKVGEKFKLRKENMIQRQKDDTLNGDLVDNFFQQINELQIQTDCDVAVEGYR